MMSGLEATSVQRANFVVAVDETGIAAIDRIAGEWSELCEHGPDDLPFYRPEWVRAYLRAFEPGARLRLFTVRERNRLLAVLPLLDTRGTHFGIPVRKLRAPVNPHIEAFGIVRAQGREGEDAVRALWAHIAGQRNWDIIELFAVREHGSTRLLIEAAREFGNLIEPIPYPPSPFVPIPASASEVDRAPRNNRLRTKLRQALRELDANHVHFCGETEANPEALKQFYELEASGWKGREGSAIACNAQTVRFYNEIAAAASAAGYFCLYRLQKDATPLAGHFGLRYRGKYFSPKVAFNEEYAQFAPGHLIMQFIFRDCFEHRDAEIDITGPPADWKSKWCAEAHPMSDYLVFQRGVFGWFLHSLQFRAKPLAKRILHRTRSSGFFAQWNDAAKTTTNQNAAE
jgi:CelD/BcsL family acetyltransferase involved in cellulose biosynthesis